MECTSQRSESDNPPWVNIKTYEHTSIRHTAVHDIFIHVSWLAAYIQADLFALLPTLSGIFQHQKDTLVSLLPPIPLNGPGDGFSAERVLRRYSLEMTFKRVI